MPSKQSQSEGTSAQAKVLTGSIPGFLCTTNQTRGEVLGIGEQFANMRADTSLTRMLRASKRQEGNQDDKLHDA